MNKPLSVEEMFGRPMSPSEHEFAGLLPPALCAFDVVVVDVASRHSVLEFGILSRDRYRAIVDAALLVGAAEPDIPAAELHIIVAPKLRRAA